MPISFHDHEVKSRLTGKRALNQYLKKMVESRRAGTQSISLSYIFCTDAYLLTINQDFLKHDTLTDIITFDLSTDKEDLEAEIYISTERVMDNAEKLGVPYIQELHRVIFHGALHLCGLKDKTPAQKKEMRTAEDLCLSQYFSKDEPST